MERTEVLVVGAGPVGLFLAGELRRHGRECIILDRLRERSAHSKALAIMPGTLEIFQEAGIVDRFLPAVNRIEALRFVTPRRSVTVPFSNLSTPYSFVSILPQWRTQELLEHRLRELGTCVRYGHELTALESSGIGIKATVQTSAGVRCISARYVVGCDGINSTVRRVSGIAFPGRTYPAAALLADVLIRTAVPVNEAHVHVHRAGVVTMFAMDERLRRIVVIAPKEPLPQTAERTHLQARLRAAGYRDSTIDEVVWSNAFHVHRRIAGAMRAGSVFLAGDSAHTHSPVGGQGMNIGLHDAFNLAGKLSRVLRGDTPEWLLDAYERERLPIARAVLRRTDVLTRALAGTNPLVRLTRERIAPALAGLPIVYGPVIRRLSLTA